MSQKWGLRNILWKQTKQMLCQTKQGDRSGDWESGGVEASVLHSRVCFLSQRNKPRVLPFYRCALMKELSTRLGLPLEEITSRSSVTMGLRNTKELRNTILLLIPFEETNSIKWFFKSRSLFVVQISFCFFFKYRTIHFQRLSPSASMTNSLRKKYSTLLTDLQKFFLWMKAIPTCTRLRFHLVTQERLTFG